MKLFTLSIALLFISIANFAQSASCPSYFRRNNGNGACPDGQLKLYFATCPAFAPIIDSVYTDGVNANVQLGLPDMSKCSQQGFISYCFIGTNMPPAAAWTIYFHNTGSTDVFGCLVPEGGPLPITMKSFSVQRNGGSVIVNWQTAYELNGQSIEIQQLTASGFITVGAVMATNNISGSNYTYTVKNSQKEVTQYRLRLLSKDAAATYSEIKSVKGAGVAIDFTIYPNPAVRNAQVSITDITEPTDVQVIDNTGRLVKKIAIKNSNTIQLNDLQPGLYRVRLLNSTTGEAVTKNLTIIQ